MDPVDPTPNPDARAHRDAIAHLREMAYWLERARAQPRRAMAYRKAADALAGLAADDLAVLMDQGLLAGVPGLGTSTVEVASAAWRGQVSERLARQRSQGQAPLVEGGADLRAALRGDLHTHTLDSDGGAPLPEMVATAAMLGHEYLAVTDHSPRLKVAHGLDAGRLAGQWARIEALNRSAPIRVLKGIEVDILEDGTLDQEPSMLAGLEIVVSSVHSKLAMEPGPMTRRMVTAIAHPRTNVLGHLTGRLVEGERGIRAPSRFDAEVVLEACRRFGVAVEINSRPERCDPPEDLLALAVQAGCLFAIDTDAHAPGQLDFLRYGCARAQDAGVPAERVVNTWPVDRLLEWAGR